MGALHTSGPRETRLAGWRRDAFGAPGHRTSGDAAVGAVGWRRKARRERYRLGGLLGDARGLRLGVVADQGPELLFHGGVDLDTVDSGSVGVHLSEDLGDCCAGHDSVAVEPGVTAV